MRRKLHNGLFGTIQIRGSGPVKSIRYKYKIRGKHGKKVEKTIDCKSNYVLALEVQLKMTQKYLSGELDHRTRLKVVFDYEVEDYNKLKTPTQDFFHAYMEKTAVEVRQSTLDNKPKETRGYKNTLRNLERFFGIIPAQIMSEINLEMSDILYKKTRIIQVKPNTVNREYDCIKKMLRFAFEEGYMRRNIAPKIKDLKIVEEKNVNVFDSIKQIEKMFLVCNAYCPEFLPLLWCFMKTGCRAGEGIKFLKSWVRRNSNKPSIFQNKTGKKVRPKVDADFQSLMVLCLDDPKNKTDYLFVDDKNKPWTEKKVRSRFKVIRNGMNLSKSEGKRLINAYTFRHTCASAWVMMFGIATAGEYIGHSDPRLTKKYYFHSDLEYINKNDSVLPWNITNIHGNKLWRFSL